MMQMFGSPSTTPMKNITKLILLACTFAICETTMCMPAWGLGEPLAETKEQLQLQYDLVAVAHGDSVTITLSVSDLGKLKPLNAVVLDIVSKSASGVEVFLSLSTTQRDGKILASAQLSRDLAERATIELVPENPPDGGKIFGWVWYPIPVKDHIVDAK